MRKKRFAHGQVLELRPCHKTVEGLWYYKARIYETVFVEEVTFVKPVNEDPLIAVIRDDRGRKRYCSMADLKAKED